MMFSFFGAVLFVLEMPGRAWSWYRTRGTSGL